MEILFRFQEILEKDIDTSTAYMLFYERKELDYDAFLPEVGVSASPTTVESSMSSGGGRTENPTTATSNKPDSDDKKSLCSVQWFWLFSQPIGPDIRWFTFFGK